MFDSANATKKIPLILQLSDGQQHTGNLIIGMTSDLPRTLNGDGRFVEFEGNNGKNSMVLKDAIIRVIPTDVPKVKKLDAGADSNNEFNPFRVLKISPKSSSDEIRAAYHKMAKIYHPDRFINVEMPDEMTKYAQNMSRLVNAAFQVLCDEAENNGNGCSSARPATSGQPEAASTPEVASPPVTDATVMFSQ